VFSDKQRPVGAFIKHFNMKKHNIRAKPLIDFEWVKTVEDLSDDDQGLADVITAITSWLAGRYAAIDNQLYGILLDKPELCEKICTPKRPNPATRTGKRAKERVESLHDLTLRAIEKLRVAAHFRLKEIAAGQREAKQPRRA
jgi:hypothetical protein